VRPLSPFDSVGEPSGPPKGGKLYGAGSLVAQWASGQTSADTATVIVPPFEKLP